jgi:NAD(P)-dependent dehydrogenase (short-subunit alcohol dehydrogenase family)
LWQTQMLSSESSDASDGKGRLAGKIAVVTGAGCLGEQIGIGRAISLAFARQGAIVVAVDRNLTAAKVTSAMIEKNGGRSLAMEADATKISMVEKMAASILESLSTIDILVNSVGGGKPGGALETTEAGWTEALSLNLTSAFNCSKSVLPTMVERRRGAIVNIGSLHGTRYPGADMLGYCVAKAGLIQLSRCIALEFAASGVRSNTLLVGAADTPEFRRRFAERYGAKNAEAVMGIRDRLVPLGQCASVWDVANAATFLASDEAGHITGTELAVDGGASAVTIPSYIPEATRLFGTKS